MLEAAAFTDAVGWAHVVFGFDVEVVTCGVRKAVKASFNHYPRSKEGIKNSGDEKSEATLNCSDSLDDQLEQIDTASGMTVITNMLVADVDINDFDALAIPGGFGRYGYYEDGYCEPVLDLIKAFNEAEKPIAAVCVAALPVAKSGALVGRKATTYLIDGRYFLNQLESMGAIISDEDLTIDKNIITSSGPNTGIFVCYELIKMLFPGWTVTKIAEAMGYDEELR